MSGVMLGCIAPRESLVVGPHAQHLHRPLVGPPEVRYYRRGPGDPVATTATQAAIAIEVPVVIGARRAATFPRMRPSKGCLWRRS